MIGKKGTRLESLLPHWNTIIDVRLKLKWIKSFVHVLSQINSQKNENLNVYKLSA